MTTELKRDLGMFSCILLVVGNIIGVGIFTTPGEIARQAEIGGIATVVRPYLEALTANG